MKGGWCRFDTDTQVGAQASNDQLEKILSYLKIGREEGAKVLIGGEQAHFDGALAGDYVQPTVFEGDNSIPAAQPAELPDPLTGADVEGGADLPEAYAPVELGDLEGADETCAVVTGD